MGDVLILALHLTIVYRGRARGIAIFKVVMDFVVELQRRRGLRGKRGKRQKNTGDVQTVLTLLNAAIRSTEPCLNRCKFEDWVFGCSVSVEIYGFMPYKDLRHKLHQFLSKSHEPPGATAIKMLISQSAR